MSITPADLAVGQVWRDKDLDAWTVDWLDLPTGRAAWTVVYADGSSDGVNAGAARTLAGFMTRNLAKLERPAPSPIPHPSALGDLYAACKAERHAANEWADLYYSAKQWVKNIADGTSTPEQALANLNECEPHCQTVWSATGYAAAIRKAGGAA